VKLAVLLDAFEGGSDSTLEPLPRHGACRRQTVGGLIHRQANGVDAAILEIVETGWKMGKIHATGRLHKGQPHIQAVRPHYCWSELHS